MAYDSTGEFVSALEARGDLVRDTRPLSPVLEDHARAIEALLHLSQAMNRLYLFGALGDRWEIAVS